MTTDAPIMCLWDRWRANLPAGGALTCGQEAATSVPKPHASGPRCRRSGNSSRIATSSMPERMVGKIAGCVERAIERLVEISECVRKPSIALAATKAIIKNWMDLSVYFVQEQTYQSLQARVKVIVETRRPRKARKRRGWALGHTSVKGRGLH